MICSPALVRARPTRTLRVLLNTGFSSPQAWLWLAMARGYLAEEGIALDVTPGAGAYTAAQRMADGPFDLAYGDMNALIEACARRPDAAPRGVYMMFNASPSCVLVSAEGPIRHPSQLTGQRLVGHGSDVALRTFGALCRHLNLAAGSVAISEAWTGVAGMAEDVLAGRAVGAFGYVSTFSGALTAADPSLLRRVRFLRYADFVPDLYGSVGMASRRLLREEPELVSRVIRAVNRGVVDMLRDHEAGLQAVGRAVPGLNLDAERIRLRATLDLEMNPELPAGSSAVALGDVDFNRLARSIALMAEGNALPRAPSTQEVFTRAHLPPASERTRP
jgi:NitT/TauT family transport system substrate-binding protein